MRAFRSIILFAFAAGLAACGTGSSQDAPEPPEGAPQGDASPSTPGDLPDGSTPLPGDQDGDGGGRDTGSTVPSLPDGSDGSPPNFVEPARYEAEDATLSGVQRGSDPAASGGAFVSFAKTGEISWKVYRARTADYDLAIGYRAPHGEKTQILEINGTKVPVVFSDAKWAETHTTAKLQAGFSTIKLIADWGYADVDYLGIGTPPPADARVSPNRIRFYKSAPRKATIFVDPKGNTLQQVARGQASGPAFAHSFSGGTLTLPASELAKLPLGKTQLVLDFNQGADPSITIDVAEKPLDGRLKMALLNVSHGSSSLIVFPTGKVAIVDSGQNFAAREVLMPFLDRHQIKKVDYYFLTHYHGDHNGEQATLKTKYNIDRSIDYKTYKAGDAPVFEGTQWKILNAYDVALHGTEENNNSMSFRMELDGFVYNHGADTYASEQDIILKSYPTFVKCHVFNTNHHLHGSVSPQYVIATDPFLFFTSADPEVYNRSAYTHDFANAVSELRRKGGRVTEALLSAEIGHVILRIVDGNTWDWELASDADTVPNFP